MKGVWDPKTMFPEPTAESGPCPPPEDLDDETRQVWETYAPELVAKGLLMPRYADAFRSYCETVVINRRAGLMISRYGAVTPGKDGHPVTNPQWRVFNQSALLMLRQGEQFGMTPLAISQVGLAAGKAKKQEETSDPRRLLAG